MRAGQNNNMHFYGMRCLTDEVKPVTYEQNISVHPEEIHGNQQIVLHRIHEAPFTLVH